MESGPKWIQDESDLQQQSLKEQLDNLETGWNDLHVLWEKRKRLLIEALNYQVLAAFCNHRGRAGGRRGGGGEVLALASHAWAT